MKNKQFVIAAGLVAILGFVLLKIFTPAKPTAMPEPQMSTEKAFVRPHSPIIGNSLARVTVVEWFDPECEACRAIHPAMKRIINDYKDRVRFVLRYMPYHGGSMLAASALEEARELGKFEEALDLLFEKQPEWGSHHAPRPDLIPEYLVTLGIPNERLDSEYLLKKHSEKIRIDEADGKNVGVRGTPTIFVGGEFVLELDEDTIRETIDEALNEAN